MPSGGLPSTFFEPTSFQFVESTVPFDSTCKIRPQTLVCSIQANIAGNCPRILRKKLNLVCYILWVRINKHLKLKVLQKTFSWLVLCPHLHQHKSPGKICSMLHHHLAFLLFPERQMNGQALTGM